MQASALSGCTVFIEGCRKTLSSRCHWISEVALGAIEAVRAYDYRCSPLYASTFPLAVPITLIGMGHCIFELVTRDPAHLNRALVISDFVTGITGLIRSFCITVVALSVISRVAPFIHSIAGPLALVGSLGNAFHAFSTLVRCYFSVQKARLAEREITPFHFYADHAKCTRKELAYDFQSDGKKFRATCKAIADRVDSLDGLEKGSRINELKTLMNRRLLHRRLADSLTVVVALASIASAVIFFVWAATPLAPLAWMIAVGVCAMSLGQYYYNQKVVSNFDKQLTQFLLDSSTRPASS